MRHVHQERPEAAGQMAHERRGLPDRTRHDESIRRRGTEALQLVGHLPVELLLLSLDAIVILALAPARCVLLILVKFAGRSRDRRYTERLRHLPGRHQEKPRMPPVEREYQDGVIAGSQGYQLRNPGRI